MKYKNSKIQDIKPWLVICLFMATIIFPNLGQTACGIRICAISTNSNPTSGYGCCNTERPLIAKASSNYSGNSCCQKYSPTSSEQTASTNKTINICSCTDLYQYLSVNIQNFSGFPTSESCNLSTSITLKGITESFYRIYGVEDWMAFLDPPIFLINCVFLC